MLTIAFVLKFLCLLFGFITGIINTCAHGSNIYMRERIFQKKVKVRRIVKTMILYYGTQRTTTRSLFRIIFLYTPFASTGLGKERYVKSATIEHTEREKTFFE